MPNAIKSISGQDGNSPRPRLLLAFYGDDFTGSTDVLEALAAEGLRPALFARPPTPGQLARFHAARAFGIAGESRGRTPAWMRARLPEIFQSLKDARPLICHYKICSTFDSSPEFGSIGCVLEIGQRIFHSRYVPVVAGAPRLGRYVMFGHLFARYGASKADERVYRIDRHPSMSAHPVTPMLESELRIHLARQTGKRIENFDILALRSAAPERKLRDLLARSPDAVIFDSLEGDSMLPLGRLLSTDTGALMGQTAPRSETAGPSVGLVIGSSGVEHALTAYWRSIGWLAPQPRWGPLTPVDRLLVVSGSCAPATEAQLRLALSQGFAGLAVPDARLAGGGPAALWQELRRQADVALQNGRSLAIYTALGPATRYDSLRGGESGAKISEKLAGLIRELTVRHGLSRVLIAGGDTASRIMKRLGIEALTMHCPLVPGAPVCRAHAPGEALDGLEIILKGGQIGVPETFLLARG